MLLPRLGRQVRPRSHVLPLSCARASDGPEWGTRRVLGGARPALGRLHLPPCLHLRAAQPRRGPVPRWRCRPLTLRLGRFSVPTIGWRRLLPTWGWGLSKLLLPGQLAHRLPSQGADWTPQVDGDPPTASFRLGGSRQGRVVQANESDSSMESCTQMPQAEDPGHVLEEHLVSSSRRWRPETHSGRWGGRCGRTPRSGPRPGAVLTSAAAGPGGGQESPPQGLCLCHRVSWFL